MSVRTAVRAAESELASLELLSCNEIRPSVHECHTCVSRTHPLFCVTSNIRSHLSEASCNIARSQSGSRRQDCHLPLSFVMKLLLADNSPGVMGVRRVESSQLCHQDSYNVYQEEKVELDHTRRPNAAIAGQRFQVPVDAGQKVKVEMRMTASLM